MPFATAMPGLTRAGVGAAAVDDRTRAQPVRLSEVVARDDDRRGDGEVGREYRGGGHRAVRGCDQAQVERVRGRVWFLDAAVDAGRGKSGRRGDAAVDEARLHVRQPGP